MISDDALICWYTDILMYPYNNILIWYTYGLLIPRVCAPNEGLDNRTFANLICKSLLLKPRAGASQTLLVGFFTSNCFSSKHLQLNCCNCFDLSAAQCTAESRNILHVAYCDLMLSVLSTVSNIKWWRYTFYENLVKRWISKSYFGAWAFPTNLRWKEPPSSGFASKLKTKTFEGKKTIGETAINNVGQMLVQGSMLANLTRGWIGLDMYVFFRVQLSGENCGSS